MLAFNVNQINPCNHIGGLDIGVYKKQWNTPFYGPPSNSLWTSLFTFQFFLKQYIIFTLFCYAVKHIHILFTCTQLSDWTPHRFSEPSGLWTITSCGLFKGK